jgi:hypothetical protein
MENSQVGRREWRSEVARDGQEGKPYGEKCVNNSEFAESLGCRDERRRK